MAGFRRTYKENGEYILGSFTFSDAETEYLKGVDRLEASRALADMGAALLFIEGIKVTNNERITARNNTPPLELKDGEVINKPGLFVGIGLDAAMMADSRSTITAQVGIRMMDDFGITAQDTGILREQLSRKPFI